MSQPKPLLSFFGATGGCALHCLVLSLNSEHHCICLVRSGSKLTNMLKEKQVSEATLTKYLHTVEGDILTADSATLRRSLSLDGRIANTIISGIGIFAFGFNTPAVTICTETMNKIIATLHELGAAQLSPGQKPLLIALSTTGLTRPGDGGGDTEATSPRDLPLLMYPLYHYFLTAAHADKIRMEDAVVAEVKRAEAERALRGFVLPRPSLLTDGEAKGAARVRVGTLAKPAVGYSISRADVGLWMFENCVSKDAGEGRWVGEKPTLTY